MADQTFDIAAAFAPQAGEGQYDPTLDVIAATLEGDVGPGGTDDGLILGDAEAGVAESGISLTIGRRRREKAALAGSFSTPISDWLAAEVRSLQVAFPWSGPKRVCDTPPVAANFAPIKAVEAIGNGVGLVFAPQGATYQATFGAPAPFSGLLYWSGNRIEMLDCRVNSLSIVYTAGSIAVATADIAVSSIKDPVDNTFTKVTLPALDFGQQASESTPVVESVEVNWGGFNRGFQSATLTITPSIDEIPDSAKVGGVRREASGRTTTLQLVPYSDDAGDNAVHELRQAFAQSAGDLSFLSFDVGTVAGDGDIAKYHQIVMPLPELDEATPDRAGTSLINDVTLIARASAANNELFINFS